MLRLIRCLIVFAILTAAGLPGFARAQEPVEWPVHALDRPQPPVVDAGPFASSSPPPSDAVVLFDGTSLDAWRAADDPDRPAPWRVENGYFEIVPGTGGIVTAQAFRDVQLHVEWMAPSPPTGEGQDRANSGIFLMQTYEVQVLDSHQSTTYPDGQAAAVYGQQPPLVNATRPPGEWQAYDIVFRAPRFDADGQVEQPARVTVFHNGVLVQDDFALSGATVHQQRASYSPHADRLPLALQDHGAPVRFRNIWLRELGEARP